MAQIESSCANRKSFSWWARPGLEPATLGLKVLVEPAHDVAGDLGQSQFPL
jgi:hypothetical protein